MSKPELAGDKNRHSQQINYVKILKVFWSRWYWIVGCTIIAYVIARLYLWYTPSVYSTSASLKFEEKNSELSDLVRGSGNSARINRLQSEMFVIESREVLLNAISRLNYNISYFLKGRVRTTELYPKTPFVIDVIQQDSVNFYRGLYNIEVISDTQFKLSYDIKDEGDVKVYRFGERIKRGDMIFAIQKGSLSPKSEYSFQFNSPESLLYRVSSGISMRETAKGSNVMSISVSDQNPTFAANLLNAILEEYVDHDKNTRNESATQTINFINQQLDFLNNRVSNSSTALANYKIRNNMVDISTSTRTRLDQLTQFQSQKNSIKLEGLLIDQLEQQVKSNKDKISLNFNIEGNTGTMLSQLIQQLNTLIIERENKSNQYIPGSKPMEQLSNRILDIKQSIINNINLYNQRNQKTIAYLDKQIALTQDNLNALPATEKDFVKLQSNVDINQKVFSYLSEKKLEAQISRAAVVAGASVVDYALPNFYPVSPVPKKVYTTALMLGLLSGIALILLVRAINPYIYDKNSVEALSQTPILGVIRRFPDFIDQDNKQALSLKKPKSVFSESVRSVRTNLSFLAGEKKSKVICITSEISGEGKSFVAVNLSSTLALIDKKVILLAADLRRSKLHKTFNVVNNKGLSSYLSHQSDLSEIIHHTSVDNLHFIPSGPVPPNPSELLYNARMRELLDKLSEDYDYVLVDTAPVGLVSDSIPLIRNSDINLFVIRSGVSKHTAASVPDRLAGEYGLRNVVIVLNAFGEDALHSSYYSTDYSGGYYSNYYYSDYGSYYGSGYYSDVDKSKWWKFWKRS